MAGRARRRSCRPRTSPRCSAAGCRRRHPIGGILGSDPLHHFAFVRLAGRYRLGVGALLLVESESGLSAPSVGSVASVTVVGQDWLDFGVVVNSMDLGPVGFLSVSGESQSSKEDGVEAILAQHEHYFASQQWHRSLATRPRIERRGNPIYILREPRLNGAAKLRPILQPHA